KSQIKDVMEAVYGVEAAENYRTNLLASSASSKPKNEKPISGHNIRAIIQDLEKRMLQHAQELEFEEAAKLRDEIHALERAELEL
ncbi:MAG: UvrB/UvrC motif-containing protein, partial [Caulobacterales bacterium]|nr:UvrB/UvrC motif-containing protein [Caulobacterales bacterium]